MTDEAATPADIKHYFVDEAGDPTLFDARGRVIAGTEGCSSHFILGVLSATDLVGLNQRLSDLHAALLLIRSSRASNHSSRNDRKRRCCYTRRTTSLRCASAYFVCSPWRRSNSSP